MNEAQPLPANDDELVTATPVKEANAPPAPRAPLHPDAVMPVEDEDPVVSLEHFVIHYTPNCFIEMCAGFRFRERQADPPRLYDRVSAYQERLAAFHNAPLS
jgi:hypothetical protein